MNKPRPIQNVFCVIMRITLTQLLLMVILTSLVSAAAPLKGQGILDRKVSLDAQNSDIKSILSEIEKQTSVVFTYRPGLIMASKKISFKVLDAKLVDVLTQLFSPEISFLAVDEEEEIVLRLNKDLNAGERVHTATEILAITVSGKVTDETGQPLPGVNVVEKGTTNGTTTDVNGRFSLNVQDEKSILVFSFIGYAIQEVSVGAQTEFTINLQPDIKALEEVVVIGFGSVKKENLTSSVSKITSDEIQRRPIPTLSEAFAGQLAGVRAQNTTGNPGAPLQIRIRGVNTINGNSNPLYVIDGIPRDDIADLNPNDVASIQVLKDASATAIYGSRGANGVILIETKQGTGQPSFNFDAFTGYQDPTKVIGMMNSNQWLAYNIWSRNEQWLRDGGSMSDPMESRPVNLQIPDQWLDPNLKGTDWQDAITASAPMQSYQLSASAKSDLGSIYISGGYFDQQGVIYNTYHKRLNFRFNGSLNVGKRIKAGMNIAPSFSDTDLRTTQGKETVLHHALMQSPLVPLNSATRDWGFPVGLGSAYSNPLERLKYTTDNTRKSTFLTNVWGALEIINGLTFKSQYSYNFTEDIYEFFQPGNVTYNNGFVTIGNSNTTSTNDWIIQNTLAYEKMFDDHSLNILIGQSADQNNFYRIDATASGWPNENIETLNVATTATRAQTAKSTYATASFFGRVGYSFKDKYLLNASIRRDGSSRFGANNKWGVFPAISVGWKLNEEPFLNAIDWLSLLKFRAAIGTSGNDRIGNYDYMAKLGINNASWGDAVVAGLVPRNIENHDLKWESTKTTDIGIDFSGFNNRVQVNFDYYINNTDDLLFNVPIPNTTGFGSFRTNLGTIQNKGWEIDVTTHNTAGKIRWTTSLNFSATKNKVLDMGGIQQFISSSWDAQFITRVGGPVAQYYVYRTDGILETTDFDNEGKALVPIFTGQEPGNVKYIDQNADGLINTNDLVPYGNNIPDVIYGMTNRVSWNNLELSVLIQGQVGGNILFLGQRQLDNGARGGINTFERWLRAWKPDYEAIYGPGENPIPDYLGVDMSWDGETPYTFGKKSDNNSDFRIYDATFLRIKNIALTYNLPRVGKDIFKAARVYVSVDNVKTFDDYPGATPESNSYGNSNTHPGVDYTTYPLSRKYTLGLSLAF